MTDEMEFAKAAFRERKAAEAIEILNRVISQKNNTNDAAAHLLKGIIYEYGGEGVNIDLSKAITNYRMAAGLIGNSNSAPLLHLARAHMKSGVDGYAKALPILHEAKSISNSAEVSLGFARYHELLDERSPLAKKHFFIAALKGRFAGFFGLSRSLKASGNKLSAALVDLIRLLLGPFIFLVLGRKATQSFDGY